MSKLRKKPVLILSLVLAMVFGIAGVYIGGTLYLQHRTAGWKRNGIAAAKAGNDAKASEMLLRYLRRHPGDTEALTYYVRSRERAPMANGQQFAETVAALKLLIQQKPDDIDDRVHLLELYVKLERGPEAIDTANSILAKDPKNIRTLELKTQVQTGMGQLRPALETATAWSAASPDVLPPQLARLQLEARLEHPASEILADATRLRESHPGSADFEVLQGFAFAHSGDDEQARSWLKHAAAHPGLSPETARALVEQLDSAGMSADALAVLQDLVKRSGNDDLRKILAQRLWQRLDWTATVDTLAPLTASDPGADVNLLAFKCISLTHLSRTDEAKTIRKSIADRIDPAAGAWTLLLRRMLDGTAVDDRKITSACQTAISADPQNSFLTYYMGEANVRRGELDLGIDAYRRAVALNSSWNLPAVQLVECLLQKGKPMQAVEVASFCAHEHPNDAASVITLARAWAAGVESGAIGPSDGLLKLVNAVQKEIPGEDRTMLIQIQLLASQKQTDEAISAARAAINRVPAPSEDVFRIIALASRKYFLGIENECYTQWEHALGITPSLAYAEAEHKFNAGHDGNAGLQVFDNLAAKSGKSSEKDWKLARASYLDLIGSSDAGPEWLALRDAYPADITIQQGAATARCAQGDWKFLQPVIDNLHKLSGEDGVAWRLALAGLMVESPRSDDDYQKASLELNRLIQIHPEMPEPHMLLARALVHMKRTDGAIEQMTAASRLDPTSVPIALQLSALLQSQGDFERVEQELDRITPQLHTREQRQKVAEILSQQNDPDKALKLLGDSDSTTAPSASAENLDDSQQDLLLAMLYRQQHKIAKADALARRLMKHPDLGIIQFASSLFLSEGLSADAEAALHHLDDIKLDPGIKDMAWGWYRLRVGDFPGATDSFTRATTEARGNAMAWRQLAITQMANHQSSQAMATIDQASRILPGEKDLAFIKSHANVLSEAGDDPTLGTMAIEVLKNPSGSEPVLELLSAGLEERHSRDREHFAAALQNISERHPECLPAQLQLAQCYLDMLRFDEAVTTAKRLMSAFPKEPQTAQVAIQVCKAAGRWREMESAGQAWKDRSPESAESADCVIAQAAIKQEHYSAALNHLQQYMAVAMQDPEAHTKVLSLNAIASVGAGESSAGESALWQLTTKDAVHRRLWISIALELPDSSAATRWLDRVADVIPASALQEQIALSEAYDRLGRKLKDQNLLTRALAIATAAGNDSHADAAIVLGAGAEAERCGHLTDAESYYLRVVKLNPSIWVAQNNLANLILKRGGDLSEAEAFAQAGVNLSPQDPQLLDTLAEVRAREGKAHSAVECMQIAVKLEPDNVVWRIRLGRYLLADGNRAGASQMVADIDSDTAAMRDEPEAVQNELKALRQQVSGSGKI